MLSFSEWARRYDPDDIDGRVVTGEPFYTDELGRPPANYVIQYEASEYCKIYGLPPIHHDIYVWVDQKRAWKIADAYERLPVNNSKNKLVAESYKALAKEVKLQWQHAVQHGMKFEPWLSDTEAYAPDGKNASAFLVCADIWNNRHLFFYTGGEPNVFMAEIDPNTGLPINDMFRAIHDYYGHAAIGADFGPRGEENAWIAHMQMFSPAAQRALTVETRGQNNWVNWGRQNYDEDGNYKNMLPSERPYAVQKCAVFAGDDEWINQLPAEVHQEGLRSTLYKTARFLGDVNAIRKGNIPQRIGRRIAGKITGRLLGKLFRNK
jgi:hypothetical protein